MHREHRINKAWVPGLLAGLLAVTSGCATRGFVRNEVGASSEVLSSRIDQNETELNTTRQDIAGVEDRVDNQASRLEEAEGDLSAARNDIETTRAEVADARELAENAMDTATAADDRAETLAGMFGDRNLYNVEETHQFYFDFDSSVLRPENNPELEAVALALDENPDLTVILEGRTDSMGAEEYNIALGEQRIEAVERYLIVQLGVPVYRIHSFSFGEAEPLFPNSDRENRERNRVVTLTLLAPVSGSGLRAATAFQGAGQ